MIGTATRPCRETISRSRANFCSMGLRGMCWHQRWGVGATADACGLCSSPSAPVQRSIATAVHGCSAAVRERSSLCLSAQRSAGMATSTLSHSRLGLLFNGAGFVFLSYMKLESLFAKRRGCKGSLIFDRRRRY